MPGLGPVSRAKWPARSLRFFLGAASEAGSKNDSVLWMTTGPHARQREANRAGVEAALTAALSSPRPAEPLPCRENTVRTHRQRVQIWGA